MNAKIKGIKPCVACDVRAQTHHNVFVHSLSWAIKNFLLEIFFPSFCLGCKTEGTLLCQDCQATLEILQYNYCLCNKNPLRLAPNEKNSKCQRCQDKKLAGIYTALSYKEKFLTKKLIHQFKYSPYIKTLAKPLAKIITEHLLITQKNTEQIWANSILVPVPMEVSGQKSRGYSQTQILTKELGHLINVPAVFDSLIKIRKTLPQMKLSAKDRAQNLKDAFAVKNSRQISGKKIFLVDDVYTTGSTMEECAKTLKSAGAKQVFGITIAREE